MNPKLRFEILKRDGFACHYCGRRAPTVVLHVDHLIPRNAGGTDDPDNLIASCSTCNLGKHTDEFLDETEARCDLAIALFDRLSDGDTARVLVIGDTLADVWSTLHRVAGEPGNAEGMVHVLDRILDLSISIFARDS